MGKSTPYKNWGNNVYSFALPIPEHRNPTDPISVEFLYSDADLLQKDDQGRRLYLSSEFDSHSGAHVDGHLYCLVLNKIRRSSITIVDEQVFDRAGNNIALSKDGFAENVLKQVNGFNDFDACGFISTFHIFEQIIAQNTGHIAKIEPEKATYQSVTVNELTQTNWNLPIWSKILDSAEETTTNHLTIRMQVETIEDTFANYQFPAEVVEITEGVVFIRHLVELLQTETQSGIRQRTRPSELLDLRSELNAALAVQQPVEIQTYIPRPNYSLTCAGIVLRKNKPSPFKISQATNSKQFLKIQSRLRIALGESVSGLPEILNLEENSCLLISGRVYSGKSVCVDSILVSLLLQNTPLQLRLLFFDLSGVEFSRYSHLPHLLSPPVNTVPKMIDLLDWLEAEANDRLQQLERSRTRNIASFNQKMVSERKPSLSHIVFFIHELSDLSIMATSIEQKLLKLARLSKIIGLHLIILTRQPLNKILPSLLESDDFDRIALSMTDEDHSIAFLGQEGAEKLLGRGDMLVKTLNWTSPLHVQGTFVSDKEIDQVVDHWIQNEMRE